MPSRSAAEEINPSIEFAAASSSVVATRGSVDASEGCENWWRIRTTKITASSDQKSEPKTKATARVSTPIPTYAPASATRLGSASATAPP